MDRAQALESLKSFLPDDKDIPTIINSCFLHPTSSWRKWTDHMGNFLTIANNKRAICTTNSPKYNDRIITDIYFKAPPNKISSYSKWAFISFGKDNKGKFSIAFLWFMGYDLRLRLIAISNNKWLENSPPLSCGIDTLRPILRNLSVEGYRVADILNVKGPAPAVILKSWATEWPPPEELKEEMVACSQELGERIIKDCEI